ncbi:glycogenin 1 isoform X1 [Megalopta genalis]|uniref:glycogenin 1 isoform X1 n=1 Tax=Megalopta genalis TaxID=115081 RepID=UPI003FD345D5
MGGYAWVTLATNDAYSLGALVLAHSLRRVGTKYELAVLITPGVTDVMREKLSAVFSIVVEVNVLDSKDEANLALLARPELGITFTKLHCWRLTQYDKCVFLDADTLVVRNCDELFEREELSAAPDVGWPDCFNSGVFVYKPSQQTFASITAFAAAKGSFDGGDQGLLNMYFSDWAHKDISKHLPFIYNMCSTAAYSYLPAFKQFGDDVRIIHFIGITKPWLQYFDTLTGIVQPPMEATHLQPLLQLWWNIFCDKVHPHLSPVMATSTLAPIWHEFSPMPFRSPVPQVPICTDIQDKSQNDIYIEPPDFSEFKDPWENYCAQTNLVIHKQEDSNATQQYYSTINRISPITILSDTINSVQSHQSHNESQLEHNREYSEYNSPLYTQHHYNQEQSNQFISEYKQQHTFCHSENAFNKQVHNDFWQNQHSVENYAPVNNTQHQHFNESQDHQKVDYQHTHQHSCSNIIVPEETRQYQHVDHHHTYQHSYNDDHRSFSEETKQHEHQHVPYHSPNDSNRALQEEPKQHQHNDHFVDHQHQVYDNTINQQATQHYEQENHSHYKTEEYTTVKIDCAQPKHTTVYHNDLSINQNAEQGENLNITDVRTNPLISTSPPPDSKPCTDTHNIATQSDPHITEVSSNAGLAGALAQITLGEPRSAEQIALEEHMRKQSWEQGHIDYMGRDSFDNIWKKICQTLSLAPSRLPSPPKEIEEPEETATDKTTKTTEPTEVVGANQSIKSTDVVDKDVAQETASCSEEQQSLLNNVPITDNDTDTKLSEETEQVTDIAPLSEKSTNEQIVSEEIIKDTSQKSIAATKSESHDTTASVSSVESTMQIPKTDVDKLGTSTLLEEALPEEIDSVISQDSVQSCPLGEQNIKVSYNKDNVNFVISTEELPSNVTNLEITVDTQQIKVDITDEKHANELSTASEVLTVSPVPIQVAESVLQVELKESMSDSESMGHEILSSTITPVHESNISCSETSSDPEKNTQINNSVSVIESTQNVEKSVEIIDTIDKLSDSCKKATVVSQILTAPEQSEFTETVTSPLSSPSSSITTDTKTPRKCPNKSLDQETELVQQVEEPDTPTRKETELPVPSSESNVAEPSLSRESPVRPSRAKELSQPSKNVQDTSSQEKEKVIKKTAKKSLEKSASEGEPTEMTEGDSSGKKVVKKVVKKVAKKAKAKPEEGLDDGAEETNSASKPKKTVKVVKKGTKSAQTLDTDAPVSENPSSSTSDTPIPPKRKTKATATKSVVKKSDIE